MGRRRSPGCASSNGMTAEEAGLPSSSSAAAGTATVTESSMARPRAARLDGREGVIVLLVIGRPAAGSGS